MPQQEKEPIITLKLLEIEVFQICDGLHQRMLTWQATAQYLEQGDSDITTIIEECSKPQAATAIADFYQQIIESITKQMDEQTP